ncbi:MAG: gamma carbonic anhydrase family protein, partial [Bacillota bacterium]
MPVLRYKNHKPLLDAEVYIARNACVIGRVSIGPRSNIWFGAVIRGDLADITIGEECSLQDNMTIHVDENEPVVVGNRVTVGHNAVLHGCKIEDDVLIGMGAIILNGAVIGIHRIVHTVHSHEQDHLVPGPFHEQLEEGVLVRGSQGRQGGG